ncbi:MAG: glutamine-synthetase adenylyltransferase, partial [Rhodospirillaceae bacterium]|nr:glutamine-synthetase adenylyltransferase [Rhodospirillaceae bacterium]
MRRIVLDNLKILPKVLDEDAARVGMEHWLERPAMTGNAELESAARTISDNASGAALLRGIFANSPYLTQLLLRDQAFAIELLDLGPDTTIAALFNSLRQTPAHELSLNNVMQRLRQAKRNAALAIAVADITGLWTLEQVTDALTEMADLGLSL